MTILADVNYFEPWWIQIIKALVIFGVIFAILPVAMVVVALIAMAIPARRAAGVDPLVSLREE